MNIPGVRKYLNELGVLLRERDRGSAAVDETTALMRAADGIGDHNQQIQLSRQRAAYEQQVAALDKALAAHTCLADVEAARTLQLDLSIKVDLAMEAYIAFRRCVSQFEYDIEAGTFAPEPEAGQSPAGMTRSAAEAELDRAKAGAEKRVELAVRAVPDRPVVLL